MSTSEETKTQPEQSATSVTAVQQTASGASQSPTAPPVTAYPVAYPPGYPAQAAIPPSQPQPKPPTHPYYSRPGGTTYVYTTPTVDYPGQPPQPQTFRVEIPAAVVQTPHQHVWSDPIPDCIAWLCCIFFFPIGILALCICRHQVCIECGARRPYPA